MKHVKLFEQFVLKDSKFIKLLQNHINACNLFNTASM